jgi:hypothetical protein
VVSYLHADLHSVLDFEITSTNPINVDSFLDLLRIARRWQNGDLYPEGSLPGSPYAKKGACIRAQAKISLVVAR